MLASALDGIARTPDHEIEPPYTRLGAHIADRANALLEGPRLEVEPVWIHETRRRMQLERELPAFAGMQLRQRLIRLGIPVDADVRRNASHRCQNTFDIELEA